MMLVTVFGRPDKVCMKCRATKEWLRRHGIEYRYVNVDKDPASEEFVRGLGYLEVPVVVWVDGVKSEHGGHWSGHRIPELEKLAARVAGSEKP